MDPFDVLSLPPRFDLEPARIEQAYLAAVGGAHPDAGGAGGGGAPVGSGAADAALINDARRILLDPERRAEALLARLGGPSKEADRSLPDGFLMEVMEIRQQIEAELEAEGDAARGRWEAWAAEQRQERIEAVGGLFGRLGAPPAPPDPETLRAIRVQLNAWRYLERLIEQLDPEYDPATSDFDR